MDEGAEKQARGPGGQFRGWHMAMLASLSSNVGAGLTLGAYGAFLAPVSQEFGASRSITSVGLALLVVLMGTLAPIIAYMVRRWSIRLVMTAGYLMLAVGWAIMSVAPDIWTFVLAFGLLCGGATACLLIVPPMILVNNWFVANRGKAAGIVLFPVLVTVMPWAAANLITAYGWRPSAMFMALCALAAVPVAQFVIDHPTTIGQQPLGVTTPLLPESGDTNHAKSGGTLWASPALWLLMACAGLVNSPNMVITGHLIAFGQGLGYDLPSAAVLLSVFGAAGLFGSFLGGALADRLGGRMAFVLIAALQLSAWLGLLAPFGYAYLMVPIAMAGLCTTAIMPIITSLIATIFGRDRFQSVMGLFPLMTMPLNFILPLLAGAMYDMSHSYAYVFLICAAFYAIAGVGINFIDRLAPARKQLAA